MATASDEQLHNLYMKLAEAQAGRQHRHEAADAYALAMHYARRAGNSQLVEYCRELLSQQCPDHVAKREHSAPLFFAQLLMRYPAEQARKELERLKTSPDDSQDLPKAHDSEKTEPHVIRVADHLPEQTEPSAATADPFHPGPFQPKLAVHHIYDLEAKAAARGRRTPRVAQEDVDEDVNNQTSPFWQTVNLIGLFVVMAGCFSLGLFARELYPAFKESSVHRVLLDQVVRWTRPSEAPTTIPLEMGADSAPRRIEVTIADGESDSAGGTSTTQTDAESTPWTSAKPRSTIGMDHPDSATR